MRSAVVEEEKRTFWSLTGGQRVYLKVKFVVDWLLALVALVVLSPVFAVIVLAIKREDGGPVFFTQKRVARGGAYFPIYKFRTMRLDTPHDMPTHLLKDPEQYITKVGRFLRRTSLDELPQLWNIIRGELAVSGPRPALWNQYDLIALREEYGVQQIRPGITGWAQIHGRDELEIDKKAALDAYYLRHLGPVIDLKCFFGTFLAVFRQDGVVEGGTGAMKEGNGETPKA